MKIVEKYRDRGTAPTREFRKPRASVVMESEVESLRRQLRRAHERMSMMFDHGFQACIRMVEVGASLDRLREASGVVAGEWLDTEPVALYAPSELDEITQVCAAPVMS